MQYFFATFYLPKDSFWMAIDLIYWNPHSECIWRVKKDLFYHIFVYDRFEGLHFHCRFWRPTSIFLRLSTLQRFRFEWQSIEYIEFRTLNVYNGLNRSFFTILSFTTVSKVYNSSVNSDAQPVFFRKFLPSKGCILFGNQSNILKSPLWTYMTG